MQKNKKVIPLLRPNGFVAGRAIVTIMHPVERGELKILINQEKMQCLTVISPAPLLSELAFWP